MDVEKTYTIPTKRMTLRLQRRFFNATNRLNSRKIGRTRRGGLQLFFVGATRHDDAWIVKFRLRKAPPGLKVPCQTGVKRLCLHEHDDIGKLLKDLTVAAAKA
ncbi:MAG: hypothetical protein RLZZ21_1392 [Planctomycetota bacterium]|jgi:hypothetical protein